jgi:renalase
MKLTIVGAGLAGLACAHRLQQMRPDMELLVVEKSRGVGGRTATRRRHNAVFDHGAQYIKNPSPAIEHLLTATLDHDTLINIPGPLWTFDRVGTIAPGDSDKQETHKWSYRDGITRLAKELARGIKVQTETRIERIVAGADGFELFTDRGDALNRSDAVLLTPPAPQTCDIVAASTLPATTQAGIVAELERSRYRRCLTITLGYDSLRDRPFYALINADKQHPIAWLALEHAKPGRDTNGQRVLIAQMAPQWSVEHWEDDPAAAAHTVAGLVSDLLDEDLRTPRWWDRQGWRYAQPDSGCDFAALNGALPGLYFAGDYTAGQGRAHLAIEQGWRVAELIAASTES